MSEYPHDAFKTNQAEDGQHYFNIVAKNGKTLTTSEMYKSKRAMINGIESVIENVVEDILIIEPNRSLPPRGDLAIVIAGLKKMGINNMIDVAEALQRGDLVYGDQS